MALVTCPECKQSISSDAATCPHCGKSKPKTSGCGIGCLGLLVLVITLGFVKCPGEKTPALDLARRMDVERQAKVETQEKEPTTVADDLKLSYEARKDDMIMHADFTIQNNGPKSVKDIEITCRHAGNSGTEIDSNRRTIYEVVKAHSKRRFPNFSMGFVHSQAVRYGCAITDFKPFKYF